MKDQAKATSLDASQLAPSASSEPAAAPPRPRRRNAYAFTPVSTRGETSTPIGPTVSSLA
jgi:hypothetical protein